MSHIRQFSVLAVALIGLAFFVPGPGPAHAAAPAASVVRTAWKVDGTWSKHVFYWAFWDNGRYQDTDGAVGSWTQDGNALTLNADAGFVYRATLKGDTASGTVYQTSDNSVAGTFKASRIKPGTK